MRSECLAGTSTYTDFKSIKSLEIILSEENDRFFLKQELA